MLLVAYGTNNMNLNDEPDTLQNTLNRYLTILRYPTTCVVGYATTYTPFQAKKYSLANIVTYVIMWRY